MTHYVNYFNDVKMGFQFGNQEDQPKISFFETIAKRIGVFLIRRNEPNNMQVNYINYALIQEVIQDNPVTVIYQNDIRSRSGKFNMPLYPDNMVKILLKAYN